MRIGVVGGSFNPPHHGHLALARAVRDALELDRMILIPAARPPHKPNDPDMAPAERRWDMTRAAAACAGFEVSGIELGRDGPSYTIDTLRALAAEHPQAELFFVIGADTVSELPTWRQASTLLREFKFVVVNRPGYDLEAGFAVVGAALGDDAAQDLRARVVTIEPQAESSTEIRRRIRAGEPWAELVPAPVAAVIRAHGLYSGGGTE